MRGIHWFFSLSSGSFLVTCKRKLFLRKKCFWPDFAFHLIPLLFLTVEFHVSCLCFLKVFLKYYSHSLLSPLYIRLLPATPPKLHLSRSLTTSTLINTGFISLDLPAAFELLCYSFLWETFSLLSVYHVLSVFLLPGKRLVSSGKSSFCTWLLTDGVL